MYKEKVKNPDLEAVLEPLFYSWRTQRKPGEAFGDFVERLVSPVYFQHSDGHDIPTFCRINVKFVYRRVLKS